MLGRLRPLATRAAHCLALAMLCPLAGHAADADHDSLSPSIATVDYAIAETLVALDTAPAAMSGKHGYHHQLGETLLPDSVVDLGLRLLPNLELLAQVAPDDILISRPFNLSLVPRLSRIARVQELRLHPSDQDTWQQMRDFTRELGAFAGHPEAAERLIVETEQHLEHLRQRLPERHKPLLLVTPVDEHHARVYAGSNLLQAVLERLGLTNAWQGPTNAWGFTLVSIDSLLDIDAQLVIVQSAIPVGIEDHLSTSGLWQYLPSVRAGEEAVIPSLFWTYGGLPSAGRFADALVAALEESDID